MWASEVFSARDSTVARAMPLTSSRLGSRPHREGSSARASSMSLSYRWSDIRAPTATSEVPPSVAQVAAAVTTTVAVAERRAARAAAHPVTVTAVSSAMVWAAPASLVSR
ncbi:Uncharacterised protein [Mycobacteroides abscessus subsp. massiliense]|nr:Uncharacterised protein [Mycobacteroides abscessus subsp. massiliense]